MTFERNESEFLALAKASGLTISKLDLDALRQRKLLVPWTKHARSAQESKFYTSAHLFILGRYFDAIQAYNHPWGRKKSVISLDEIIALNTEIQMLNTPNISVEKFNFVQSSLNEKLQTFIEKINPLGVFFPIAAKLNGNALREFKYAGRLCLELLKFQKDLNRMEKSAPEVKTKIQPAEIKESIIEEIIPQEAEIEIPSIASDGISETSFAASENPVSLPPLSSLQKPEPTKPVKSLFAKHNEKEIPPRIQAENNVDATLEVSLNEIIFEEEETGISQESSPATKDLFGILDPSESSESSENWSRKATDTNIANKKIVSEKTKPDVEVIALAKKENPFQHSGRTRELVGIDTDLEESSEDIKQQVEALNVQRQTLIGEKDWGGLAELYENKIELFTEPAERQEVLLTIATLREVKLKDPNYAIIFFKAAIENGAPKGLKKAYEGLQRIGLKQGLRKEFSTWLEDRIEQNVNDFEKPILQYAFSSLLREGGDIHRAYLSYAAFLTGNPAKFVTEKSLQILEEFSEGVEESELESFFEDLSDFEEKSPDLESTRTLIAKHAGLFYAQNVGEHEKRNPMMAMKYLRLALDRDPRDQVAYHELSHIYQEEENWPDLIQLASNRYMKLSPSEHANAAIQLEQFIAEDIEEEGSLERYKQWAEIEPNSWAIEGLIAIFSKPEKGTEGYAHLQHLLEKVTNPEKKQKLYKKLAEIAVESFDSIEDAMSHYENGIALDGAQTPSLMEGLAKIMIEAEKWTAAILVLEKITSPQTLISTDHKRAWLHRGIQIANDVGADTELSLFSQRLVEL